MKLISATVADVPFMVLACDNENVLLSEQSGDCVMASIEDVNSGEEIDFSSWRTPFFCPVDKEFHFVSVQDLDVYMKEHLPVEKSDGATPVHFSKYYSTVERLKKKQDRKRRKAYEQERLAKLSAERCKEDEIITAFSSLYHFVPVRMNEIISQ